MVDISKIDKNYKKLSYNCNLNIIKSSLLNYRAINSALLVHCNVFLCGEPFEAHNTNTEGFLNKDRCKENKNLLIK